MSDDLPFLMTIEDFFVIKGRGIVVTGLAKSGMLRKGETVSLVGNDKTTEAIVAGIEINVSEYTTLLLKGLDDNTIEAGMVITSTKHE